MVVTVDKAWHQRAFTTVHHVCVTGSLEILVANGFDQVALNQYTPVGCERVVHAVKDIAVNEKRLRFGFVFRC